MCAFIAVVACVFYPTEPSFEGRRLSKWILVAHAEGSGREKALAIVRQHGNQSIPLLLRWLRESDRPSLKERIFDLKGWLMAHRIMKPGPITLTGLGPNHRTIAGFGLAELDSDGKKAVVPVLIRMLGDQNHKPDEISEIAGRAFVILPTMAPESINPLIAALSSQDYQVRQLAEGALGNIGPDARAAIPVLEKRLKNNDPNPRVFTAETIGKLGGDPHEFIPVVIQSLPEMKGDYLDSALNVLVRYKEHSKPAIPALLNLLKNTPPSANTTTLRGEIMSALQEIDPQSAAKAGVQSYDH
jgi:hypothetical protein